MVDRRGHDEDVSHAAIVGRDNDSGDSGLDQRLHDNGETCLELTVANLDNTRILATGSPKERRGEGRFRAGAEAPA